MSYTRSANVVVMGPAGVGKTDLVHQWMDPDVGFKQKEKTSPTIGVEYKKKEYEGLAVHVSDMGGLEKYRPNYPFYLEKAHVVLCCFDMASEVSFNEAITMLKTVFQDDTNRNRPYVVFVGTKFDTCSAPAINQDRITQEIEKLTKVIPGMEFHSRYLYTSAKARASNHNLKSTMDTFFNRIIPSLCEKALQKKEVDQPASFRSNNQGKMFIPEIDADSTEISHDTYFQRHPNVRMGLAVTALVIGLAAIAVATVATCGVAGLLGAAAASIAATLTFGASLTTVGAVAGGVGLFGGLSVAGGSYLMHTRPRGEKVENNGSPFGGEKLGHDDSDETSKERAFTFADLKFAIKNNGAVRLFTGAMNRAGECLPFRGSRRLSYSNLDD